MATIGEIIFVIIIDIMFFLVMKLGYSINPWEIKKMLNLYNKTFF